MHGTVSQGMVDGLRWLDYCIDSALGYGRIVRRDKSNERRETVHGKGAEAHMQYCF